MNIEDLPQTLIFFQQWNGINPSHHEFLQQNWIEMIDHLHEDGYEIVKRNIESRNLMDNDPSIGVVMFNLSAVLFCIICSGMASGLTQGLLSLDFMEMKVKSASGTPKEKEYSNKVLPIISNHHLLLVTLLLWNAFAAEALPIFLNNLVPEYVAIVISVTLVLIFGEILPASILTGPKQLEIAASLVPLVYLILFIFFPLAYPMSKVLDVLIGNETGITVYNRQELATMMHLQHEEAQNTPDPSEKLIQKEEVKIIEKTLKFRDLRASDVMTFVENIFMVSCKDEITESLIEKITLSGYSRIPVYDAEDKNNLIGLIYSQDLICTKFPGKQTIGDFFEQYGHPIGVVWYDQNLSEVLKILQNDKENMVMVRDIQVETINYGAKDPTYKLCGIITLQDIVEEIVGGKVTDLSLNDTEIQKMYSAVMSQIPQIFSYTIKHRVELLELIKQSEICILKKLTQDWEVVTNPGDLIVKKGKFMNYCIVILEGNVRLEFPSMDHDFFFDGNEQEEEDVSRGRFPFPSRKLSNRTTSDEVIILGPGDIICADALVSNKNTYTPNFNAYIESRHLRYAKLQFNAIPRKKERKEKDVSKQRLMMEVFPAQQQEEVPQ